MCSSINEIGIKGLAKFRTGNIFSTVTARVSGESFVPENKLENFAGTYEPYPSGRDLVQVCCSLTHGGEAWIPSLSLRYLSAESNVNTDSFSDHRTDRVWTYQAGLKYILTEEWGFKLNYGTYVRFPGMGELFGDWGYFLGNPELDHERGVTGEAAFEYTASGPDRGFAYIDRAYAGVFRTDITDYIQYLFNAQGIGRPENLGEAELTGFECSLHHRKGHVRFDHGLTLQRPLNRTYVDYNYGKILPGRAQALYTAELSWTAGNLEIFGSFLYEYGIFYDAPNMRRAPDKKPVSIGAGWSFSSKNNIVLRIDNVFDRRYEDYGGYPLPGRVFSLTVQCGF
jgi:iron complex outermembrane receptor protein